ncbi:LapA family protein [Desulfosarcina sp.]|uniref:LapA family protein n=1 Tax=Desulfosarcina sp. TaxID=2027861 RepID=UPI0035660076
MKLRLSMWTLIILTMALIIYQNREFYLSEQTLTLNLYVAQFGLPPLANVTQVLLFFLAGIVLACVSLYHERFKLRREIDNLNTAFQSCAQQVTSMKPEACAPPKNRIRNLMGRLNSKKVATEKALPTANEAGTFHVEV